MVGERAEAIRLRGRINGIWTGLTAGQEGETEGWLHVVSWSGLFDQEALKLLISLSNLDS